MRGRSRRRLLLEVLEPRLVLSQITWNTSAAPTGGNLDLDSNWIGGVAPSSGDTAIIEGLTSPGTVYLDSNLAASISGLITDSSVTLEVITGSYSLEAGSSSTLGGPVIVNPGAAISVDAGASVTIGAGQTITVGGTLSFATGATVSFSTAEFATTQIVVNGLLTATNAQFSNSGNASLSQTQIYVNAGGELTATNSTFGIDELFLAKQSVLNSGDLTGNTFNSAVYAPALALPLLSDNQSFQDVDILPTTLSSGQSVSLIPLGTVTTANQRYVFPGPFTVGVGATLSMESGASVLIRDAQQLLVNGTLNITGASSVAIEDQDDGGFSGGITVNGTITISNTSLTREGGTNGDDISSLQVNSGAQVTISATTFAWDQLLLDSGAGTISISGNDFSGVGANGVIATGDPGSHIPLDHNYWGTGVPSEIDAKILDHADDANRPFVDYQPFVNASATSANPAQVFFSPTDQTVNLSATVNTTLGAAIDGGTVTFTVLNGAQVIGQTGPAPVSNGAAAANFTLPGNTPIGQYVIKASYGGTALFLPSTDTSQVLTVTQQTPTKLVVHLQPSPNATAGQALTVQPVIYEEDQNGSLVTSDNSTVVTVSLGSGVGPLHGTLTATVTGGVATFTDLFDNKAETITLTFTNGSLTSSATNPTVVSPGVATQLVIDIPPYTSVIAGTPLTDPIVLNEVDQYGNVETGDNSTVVTVTLAAGAGTLKGTTTAKVSAGVASFDYLENDTAGSLSLKFTTGGLPPVISKPTTVAPAPATRLIVNRPPGGVVAGNAFTLEADARDPYGNLDTSYAGPVTVGLGSGSSGTLSGTLTMTAVNGVATFTDLVSDTSGPLSLSVTSGSLTPATPSVNVIPTPTITGEIVVMSRKTNKKGKQVGKAVFKGFELDFSTPMNPATAGSTSNYQVEFKTTTRIKKKSVTVYKPVPFSAGYSQANGKYSVMLSVKSSKPFARGGRITITNTLPSGVTSEVNVPLGASDTVFNILPNAKRITRG